MEGVINDFGKGSGRRNVVGNSSNGNGLSPSFNILPFSEDAHQDIGGSAIVQQLRDKVQVGNEGGLKNDGHVGSVKKLDGVGSLLSAIFLVLDRKNDAPSLEVNDNDKDKDCGHEIGQVGKILTIHRLLNGADLVAPGNEKMEQCNNGAFEFSPASRIDSGGTECLPDNVLADIGRDKERDSAAQAIALLKQLIQREHDQSRAKELADNEERISRANAGQIAVHAADDVRDGFSHRDENSKQFLRAGKEGAVFLDVVIDLNDAGSGEELHDEAGGDDGGDAEFHEGAAVGGEDDAHPVEGVGGFGGLDAVDGDLTADEEDEQGDGGPKNLFAEGNLHVKQAVES